MATLIKTLLQTKYAASSYDAALYITPSGKKTIIKEIILCNVTTSAQPITFDIVQNGYSPGSTIFSEHLVSAKDTLILPYTLVMESLYEFWGLASSSNSITIRISGIEF